MVTVKSGDTMLKAENLFYSYDNGVKQIDTVLDNLNLNIKKGEFVAVLGHNGCGKSTLAKHFNGLLIPVVGNVYVNGINTKDEEKIWDIRRQVGMVFQNPDNQIVANVVEEDVAFAPENLGVPSEEIRKRVDEALKIVDMYESMGVDRLATWTYRGGLGTSVAAPDPIKLWDAIGENYKRVLKK